MAKVVTGKTKLCFVNVSQPKGFNGNEPKYSVSVLVPKSDTDTLKKLKAAIEQVKQEDNSKWGGKIPGNLHLPLHDGDTEREDDPVYSGMIFFNATSKRKPLLLNRDNVPVVNEEDIYSGCYARVSVNLYGYSANGSRGIAVGLNAVKKIGEGEKLGATPASAADFDDGFVDEAIDDLF